ncbi:multicopper oxidase family protein [Streptomyces lushanensis]|uniref:multicopper oxidase family protein n=1 Tax=Streptomyces lushanensis TaxID=1434255 RepID=UPI000829FC8F|nr:multicopper oxidase family protein [Streptomyces lushanensis]
MRSYSKVTGFLVGLALAVTWLSGCSEPPPERAVSGAAAGQQARGADLQDPPEVVSDHGVLRTTVVVERRKVWVGDRRLWALTYNGRYMPPTLRARPGDRIELAMVNRVGKKWQGVTMDTNLHTHGLHVSPRQPADDIFIAIKPGTTYNYAYQLPRDITPGTYWYHSHIDMYSAPQVAGGESGVIIIDGLRTYLPPSLRGITERVVALKDNQIDGDAIKIYPLSIQANTNRTVNGQQNPVIRIRPGETQLWRLANIGANIYYKLRLKGFTFHVIAQDGYPVHRIYSADTLIIPAAARYDVLVQAGGAGTAQLETLPFDTGPAGNTFPRVNLATVVTEGPRVAPARIPSRFGPLDDLTHAEIADRKTMVYTENQAGTQYFINGKYFDPNRVDFVSRLNTVEEWTVRNDSEEDHSFHVHTNQFQVMSLNGKAVDPAHSWHETVNILRGQKLVLRIRLADFTGRTVVHCHILNHEDMGMMSVLDIVDGRTGRGKGHEH